MAKHIAAVAAGTVAGLALLAGAFGLWMVCGADPKQDPLLSFRFRFRRAR
jgi:hypothetical protein